MKTNRREYSRIRTIIYIGLVLYWIVAIIAIFMLLELEYKTGIAEDKCKEIGYEHYKPSKDRCFKEEYIENPNDDGKIYVGKSYSDKMNIKTMAYNNR